MEIAMAVLKFIGGAIPINSRTSKSIYVSSLFSNYSQKLWFWCKKSIKLGHTDSTTL